MAHRKCFVPTCTNDSINSPDKIFVRIRENLRKKWCIEANAEYFCVQLLYCCEDHFDPIADLKNYFKCKLMNQEPILKPTAVLKNVAALPQKAKKKKGKSNYTQIKMGLGQRLHPATETVSSSIHCQQDQSNRLCEASTSRPAFAKSPKADLIEECHKETQILPASNQYNNDEIAIEEEIVVKTENAEEIFIKTEPIYPDETVPEVADVRFHDKGVQTKPDVEHRGVQGCPRRFRSKAVQYNSDVPPRITFLKLVRDETEKMMVRVYKYLRDELEILKLMTAEQVLVALEQVSGRAAQATGVSELDMQQTLDKYKDLIDKQPTKKILDKTNKPKKKRKQGMHARTFSFSNESTDDEQPPKVQRAETDSGSAGVSVQTVIEPSAMEVDCGGGNSIDETTARRETSVQEEVHDSNGESTDEALEEEPEIYIKDEPLTEDDDSANPLDIGVVAPSITHSSHTPSDTYSTTTTDIQEEPEIYIKDEPLTEDDDSANPLDIGVVAPSITHSSHTPSDTYSTTTTDIQTYDPGEDVRIKTEYGEPEPSHDHTYHKNTCRNGGVPKLR